MESTASSPRGAKKSRLRQSSEMAETDEESGMLSEVTASHRRDKL